MKKNLAACLFVVLLVALLAGNVYPAAGMPPSAPNNLLADIWLDVRRSGDIMYFVYQSPQMIRRYDLAAAAWLDHIPLTNIPAAFAVEGQYLYMAMDREVYRYNLDGTAPLLLHTTVQNPKHLFVCSNNLYILDGINVYRVNVNSPGAATQKAFGDGYSKLQPVCGANLVYGVTASTNSYVNQFSIGGDGSLIQIQSRYFNIPYLRLYLDQSETRLTISNGQVFAAQDYSWTASFAGIFDDLTYTGDQYVVLRGNTLYRYAANFFEQGRYTLTQSTQRIAAYGSTIFAFLPVSNHITVQQVPLDLLQPAYPPAINPANLKYYPNRIEHGNDIVYLLDKGNRNIHRWSVIETRYLASIAVQDAPASILYHPEHNRLYVAYSGGKLTWFDPANPQAENNFAHLPGSSCGLAAAGQYLVVCFLPNNAVSYNRLLYRANGEATSGSAPQSLQPLTDYSWSPIKRRLYTVVSSSLYQQEVTVEGALGVSILNFSVTQFARVSPDGLKVLAGNGRIYKWDTLSQLDTLANDSPTADAVWNNDGLYTLITRLGNDYRIQKWDDMYQLEKDFNLWGAPLRLVNTSRGLLAVTLYSEQPFFSIFDANLNPIDPPFSKVFIPCLHNKYCPDLLETFSTPNPFWFTGDTRAGKVSIVNGEYRILASKANTMLILEAPMICTQPNDTISVDARLAQESGTYGLVFGIAPDYSKFILFEIDPSNGSYSLWIYQYGDWDVYILDQWSTAINTRTAKNKIEVIIQHAYDNYKTADAKLLINNITVYRMSLDNLPDNPRNGLFVAVENIGADVRFDNYLYANFNPNGAGASIFAQPGPAAPDQTNLPEVMQRPYDLIILAGE
jgi:hypothetical protein